jgi:hypothetical protein
MSAASIIVTEHMLSNLSAADAMHHKSWVRLTFDIINQTAAAIQLLGKCASLLCVTDKVWAACRQL